MKDVTKAWTDFCLGATILALLNDKTVRFLHNGVEIGGELIHNTNKRERASFCILV